MRIQSIKHLSVCIRIWNVALKALFFKQEVKDLWHI